jgi:hypothetical protein
MSASLLRVALASLFLYVVMFTVMLDRPLSHGELRHRIEAKLAIAATIETPKLVILAGSNGPYSHHCETLSAALDRPCVNGGVAVGIGLDYLFARWRPLLRPGDVVYLPLEQEQYVRRRAAIVVGPDAAIMARHDWPTLGALAWDRRLGALFAFDARALVMSLLEMALRATGFDDPRAQAVGTMSRWGDQTGHTAEKSLANQPALARLSVTHQAGSAITAGDGARDLRDFLAWCQTRGIRAVGGLATGFADQPIPAETLAAIIAVYHDAGAGFLPLPNQARYPREAFFDSAEHLHETAQRAHSRLVGLALRNMLAETRLAELIF